LAERIYDAVATGILQFVSIQHAVTSMLSKKAILLILGIVVAIAVCVSTSVFGVGM
jgi:hypothetical protein